MFNLQAFNAVIRQDNPTFGRIRSSDLDPLVRLVSSGGFSVNQVAQEMKRISGEKWRKYARTRTYLISEIPMLAGLVRASLVNFRTQRMEALSGGNIRHSAVWDSDSGNLQDLASVRVRESVTWGAAPPQARPFLRAEYQDAGQHFGMGNNVTSPGNAGSMSDEHDAIAAWGPNIFSFAGPGPISYLCSQVYQYSDDNRPWNNIANSAYEIVRTVSTTRTGIKFEILKRSVPPNAHQESRSNSREVPRG
jgi:hypothetical protein